MVGGRRRRRGLPVTSRLPTFIRRDFFTPPRAVAGVFSLLRASMHPWAFGSLHIRLARWCRLAPGTRENYFHFLIGYLLPLVHAQSRRRFQRFLAVDCGPLMTPILAETLTRLGHDFRIVGADAVERQVFVESWDKIDPSRPAPEAMAMAAALMRRGWEGHVCQGVDCTAAENLLIRRSDCHEHYLGGASHFQDGYGTFKRGITNLDDVSDRLRRAGVPHAVYEPGGHSLGCQIAAFTRARRLLGMRGAEWANLIWSPPGARVRMLDHDPPAWTLTHFMRRLHIHHEFSVVPGRHAPEDCDAALRFFTEP